MFYLQYVATVIAIVIMLALATYVARRSATAVGLRAGWGEVTQSLIFHQVRSIQKLTRRFIAFARAIGTEPRRPAAPLPPSPLSIQLALL